MSICADMTNGVRSLAMPTDALEEFPMGYLCDR